MVYTTFDWATRDEDGYYFVLGRTDDVINVAGHRLGTREIEEAVQAHPTSPKSPWSAWPTRVKGQVPVAFAVVKDAVEDRHAGARRGPREGNHGDRRPRDRRHRAPGAGATS